MTTLTYLVPDMSCAHCKARIENEVSKLEGIQSAEVDLDEKQLNVVFDENNIKDEDIISAVDEAGYTAKQI